MSNYNTPLLYREIGGIRKGKCYALSFHATWPFAEIEIYQDKIVLKCLFFFKTELKVNEIDFVEPVFHQLKIMGGGVKINHHNKKTSPYIVFWSFSMKKLLNKFKEVNIKVKE